MVPYTSIVTGTFNRIQSLKYMIESVRQSVGGIPYEIVIVDGGSTDGTIEWCKTQNDINLIEQGELLGAVKAFNEGAANSKGKYVILANDDILFIDESIQVATAFMDDRMDVGIGCFWQDRNNRGWHTEQMPVIVNNKLLSFTYGQVCIVPKWLGDKVGWWGNYLHTYGGDNELSCNILELGYSVEAIPCACIHDGVLEDALRKINNPDPNKIHPDSIKWRDKWKKQGDLIGPIIPKTKTRRDDGTALRIVYAPIYEEHSAIQHVSKRGLRWELEQIGLVQEVDYIRNGSAKIYDEVLAFKPHLLITQFHDHKTDGCNVQLLRDLRQLVPNCIFVNWNGDCFPDNFLHPEYMAMMNCYDLCGFVQVIMEKEYNDAGIQWFYWQIGYEPADREAKKDTPRHDVVFLGNYHFSFRNELASMLRSLQSVDVGLYGRWPANYKPNGHNLYNFDAGAQIYSACKIAISDNRPNSPGFVSNRLIEAMASGAFVLQRKVERLDELMGLTDGVHYVEWDTLEDLKNKIYYWLNPDNAKERKHIAHIGQEFILNEYSFRARVEELLKVLKTMKLLDTSKYKYEYN